MTTTSKALIAAGAVALIAVVGVGIWFFASSNVGDPTDVTAPPLETTTTLAAGETTTTAGEDTTTTVAAGGATTFELSEGTVARFFIDEELRGDPVRVVAESTEVVGLVEIDTEDLANSRVGTILINARVFQTDNSFRDRAIRGPILDSDAFEFIEFAPTAVEGLSGPGAVGDTLSFTITGDLTIKETTLPATFEVEATLTAEDRLEGTAGTTVDRTAYGLNIPSAPGVANVSESVDLELEFVAVP